MEGGIYLPSDADGQDGPLYRLKERAACLRRCRDCLGRKLRSLFVDSSRLGIDPFLRSALDAAGRLSMAEASVAVEIQLVAAMEPGQAWPEPARVTPLPPIEIGGGGSQDSGTDGSDDQLDPLRTPTTIRPHFCGNSLRDVQRLSHVGDTAMKKAHAVHVHENWGAFRSDLGVGGLSFRSMNLSIDHPLYHEFNLGGSVAPPLLLAGKVLEAAGAAPVGEAEGATDQATAFFTRAAINCEVLGSLKSMVNPVDGSPVGGVAYEATRRRIMGSDGQVLPTSLVLPGLVGAYAAKSSTESRCEAVKAMGDSVRKRVSEVVGLGQGDNCVIRWETVVCIKTSSPSSSSDSELFDSDAGLDPFIDCILHGVEEVVARQLMLAPQTFVRTR